MAVKCAECGLFVTKQGDYWVDQFGRDYCNPSPTRIGFPLHKPAE